MFGPPTNGRILAGWAIGTGVVGFAQLFRSLPEQIVGVVYLVGAAVLAVATIVAHRRLAAVGMGIITVGFAARAVSTLGLIDTSWHGRTIVLVTWAGLAFIAANRTRRIAEGW